MHLHQTAVRTEIRTEPDERIIAVGAYQNPFSVEPTEWRAVYADGRLSPAYQTLDELLYNLVH